MRDPLTCINGAITALEQDPPDVARALDLLRQIPFAMSQRQVKRADDRLIAVLNRPAL